MKNLYRFKYTVLVLVVFCISCTKDEEKALLENMIMVDGLVYTVYGGFIDGDHTLQEVDGEYIWDFDSILTLLGERYGTDVYGETKREFLYLQIRMHSDIHGLASGEYTYSENGNPLSFNPGLYTTSFDLGSNQNIAEGIIVSGSVSVDRYNGDVILIDVVDHNGIKIRGNSTNYLL